MSCLVLFKAFFQSGISGHLLVPLLVPLLVLPVPLVIWGTNCTRDDVNQRWGGKPVRLSSGPVPGLEWTSSHQCTSWGWTRSTRFADEHPPCPSRFFFFTSSLPWNSLPPPSYLPPTNPTPPHSIARAPETSSSYGAGVGTVAVERELEWLELERDPHAHKKIRCLRFFFGFFVFFVWRRLEKSSSFFVYVAAIAFFFFLFLCYTAAQLQRCSAAKKAFFFFFFAAEEENFLLLFSRRKRPSFSFFFFVAL